MILPHKMRKATVFALQKNREDILNILHKEKLFQIINLKTANIKEVATADSPEELKKVSDHLLKVSRIVSILKLAPKKISFTQSMLGLDVLDKKHVEDKNTKLLLTEGEQFLTKNEERIVNLEEAYNSALERKDEVKELKKIITLFSSLNIPLHLIKNTDNISLITGRMPTNSIDDLKKKLDEDLKGYAHLVARKEDNKNSIVIVITLTNNTNKTNFLCKKLSFRQIILPEVPNKDDLIGWITEEENKNENNIKEILEKISKEEKKIFNEAIVLREELEVMKLRLEAVHSMLATKNYFVMQGWVKLNDIDKLDKMLDKTTKGKVVILTNLPNKEDQVPVEPTNPGWLKPFEILTELYSLPNYRDLDPTFIVGPIFLIYAGFMLTDFIYGLGLVFLGSWLYKKFAKYDISMKYIGVNIIGIGAFSMLFGVLTGSYLGDVMQYINPNWTSANLAIWADPLSDPLYFLIISIVVALIHLNFGLILGMLSDIRNKDYKSILSQRGIWWILQISIVAFIFGYSLSGKILLGLVVLLVVIFEGPLGILGLTGFLGDVISYSRLFALALSTAGIAMTVNLLANLVRGIPFAGIFLAILIFVGGHLFSFVMNSLGGFVHSIRLQFVEFFGKFYEGGGDRFTPFAEERTYTEVKR